MTTNTAPPVPALPDLTATTGWMDIAVVSLIIIAALFYLYIKLWKNKGRCDGCNGCDKAARQPKCQQIGTIATIRPMADDNRRTTKSSAQK